MGLISSAKLLLRFTNTSLYEEVSNSTMSAVGDSSFPQILSGGGYDMSQTQYLLGDGAGHGGYDIGVSTAMTLGFWLYPVNPGLAINPATGEAASISMPLMDFNDIGVDDTPIIRLTENTTSDGENNLTISLNGGEYEASTEDYAPSKWHHFWIVFDGASLYVYVDCKIYLGSYPQL